MSTKPEKDKLIAGEYDGIQEYDNPIPLWLNLVFVGSVVFAVIYGVVYHWTDIGQMPLEAYAAEMAEIEKQRAEQEAQVATVDLAAIANDPAAVEAGGQTYQTYCASCHLSDGTGQIGPNLTDAEWRNGDGSMASIVEIVDTGVLDKGMPAWGPVLGPEKTQQVSAYVHSLSAGASDAGGDAPDDAAGAAAAAGTGVAQ